MRLDAADCLRDGPFEPVVREGLVQKIDCIEIEAVQCVLCMRRREDQAACFGQLAGDFEPVDAVHLDVEKYQIRTLGDDCLESVPGLVVGVKLQMSEALAELLDDKQCQRFVVDGYAGVGVHRRWMVRFVLKSPSCSVAVSS